MKVFFLVPQQVALQLVRLLDIWEGDGKIKPKAELEWGKPVKVVELPTGVVEYVGPFPHLVREERFIDDPPYRVSSYVSGCMNAIDDADAVMYQGGLSVDYLMKAMLAYAVGKHKNFLVGNAHTLPFMWRYAVPHVCTHSPGCSRGLSSVKDNKDFQAFCARLLAFDVFKPPFIPEISTAPQRGYCHSCGKLGLVSHSMLHAGEFLCPCCAVGESQELGEDIFGAYMYKKSSSQPTE